MDFIDELKKYLKDNQYYIKDLEAIKSMVEKTIWKYHYYKATQDSLE